MTQDEIIEMARQAGGYSPQKYPEEWRLDADDLVRFAKLVKERTWVGLIPEEIDEIIENSIDKVDALIQTMDKLKEKNT
jgi:hypothetical protein